MPTVSSGIARALRGLALPASIGVLVGILIGRRLSRGAARGGGDRRSSLAESDAARARTGEHGGSSSLDPASAQSGENEPPVPLVMISDAGQDLDDEMALVLLSHLSRLGLVECRAVVANLTPAFARARLVRGTLDVLHMHSIPVGIGTDGGSHGEDAFTEHAPYTASALGMRSFLLEPGRLLLLRTFEAAAACSLTVLLISSLKDIALFLRDNEKLFVAKVKEVVVMGGAQPYNSPRGRGRLQAGGAARREPFIEPDTAHNNEFDRASSAYFYRRCQELGVRLVIVSRWSGYKCSVPRHIYDDMADAGSIIGCRLRNAQRMSIESLWRRACAPSGSEAREGLPDRCDRAWFLRRFCDAVETDRSDTDSVWDLVTTFAMYDSIALLAAVPSLRARFFCPIKVGIVADAAVRADAAAGERERRASSASCGSPSASPASASPRLHIGRLGRYGVWNRTSPALPTREALGAGGQAGAGLGGAAGGAGTVGGTAGASAAAAAAAAVAAGASAALGGGGGANGHGPARDAAWAHSSDTGGGGGGGGGGSRSLLEAVKELIPQSVLPLWNSAAASAGAAPAAAETSPRSRTAEQDLLPVPIGRASSRARSEPPERSLADVSEEVSVWEPGAEVALPGAAAHDAEAERPALPGLRRASTDNSPALQRAVQLAFDEVASKLADAMPGGGGGGGSRGRESEAVVPRAAGRLGVPSMVEHLIIGLTEQLHGVQDPPALVRFLEEAYTSGVWADCRTQIAVKVVILTQVRWDNTTDDQLALVMMRALVELGVLTVLGIVICPLPGRLDRASRRQLRDQVLRVREMLKALGLGHIRVGVHTPKPATRGSRRSTGSALGNLPEEEAVSGSAAAGARGSNSDAPPPPPPADAAAAARAQCTPPPQSCQPTAPTSGPAGSKMPAAASAPHLPPPPAAPSSLMRVPTASAREARTPSPRTARINQNAAIVRSLSSSPRFGMSPEHRSRLSSAGASGIAAAAAMAVATVPSGAGPHEAAEPRGARGAPPAVTVVPPADGAPDSECGGGGGGGGGGGEGAAGARAQRDDGDDELLASSGSESDDDDDDDDVMGEDLLHALYREAPITGLRLVITACMTAPASFIREHTELFYSRTQAVILMGGAYVSRRRRSDPTGDRRRGASPHAAAVDAAAATGARADGGAPLRAPSPGVPGGAAPPLEPLQLRRQRSEEDASDYLVPDMEAQNNFLDVHAAQYFMRRCQELGVRLVVVSRHLARACRMPRSLYDHMLMNGGPVGAQISSTQSESISALWARVCAGADDDNRMGLPARCNKEWFRDTFCNGAAQVTSLDASDHIWSHVSHFNIYNPLALLAAIPSASLHYFELAGSAQVVTVRGVEHRVIGRPRPSVAVSKGGAPDDATRRIAELRNFFARLVFKGLSMNTAEYDNVQKPGQNVIHVDGVGSIDLSDKPPLWTYRDSSVVADLERSDSDRDEQLELDVAGALSPFDRQLRSRATSFTCAADVRY